MSEFELNIQSQPLFTVSVSADTNQTPYSVEIDTPDSTMFTVTIGESGTGGVGIPGANGRTILNGTSAPTTEGEDGDFYLHTSTFMLYGPKAAGSWPVGVSLIGPQGIQGEQGEQGEPGEDGIVGSDGKTWTSGSSAPSGGVDGDFYLQETTYDVYKKISGTWTLILNVKGADGPPGADGDNGLSYPAYAYTIKTADYIAVTGDFSGNKAIGMNVVSANNFTVNSGLSPVEPVTIIQIGAGRTTIVAGSGVSIYSSNGLKLRTQNSVASLLPFGTNTYILSGDITT